MPCYDRTPDEEAHERRQAAAAQEKRINERTRHLCEAMGLLERSGLLKQCSMGLRTWWKDHKEADASRKAALADAVQKKRDLSAAKDAAKKKLTPRERRLLGIKD